MLIGSSIPVFKEVLNKQNRNGLNRNISSNSWLNNSRYISDKKNYSTNVKFNFFNICFHNFNKKSISFNGYYTYEGLSAEEKIILRQQRKREEKTKKQERFEICQKRKKKRNRNQLLMK